MKVDMCGREATKDSRNGTRRDRDWSTDASRRRSARVDDPDDLRSSDWPGRVTEGPEIKSGLSLVAHENVSADTNGCKTFTVKAALPYTAYTDKDNVIDAEVGDDWVNTGWGNDSVHGVVDKDEIHGLAGNDVIFGDAGDDNLFGGGTDVDDCRTIARGLTVWPAEVGLARGGRPTTENLLVKAILIGRLRASRSVL